jgi:hypothetical protein
MAVVLVLMLRQQVRMKRSLLVLSIKQVLAVNGMARKIPIDN